MIAINQITVRFGSFELFSDINFMINPRDRIGLVGKNGAGKSTLLKLIIGMEKPDEGQITTPTDITIGYLPQQMTPADGKTVFDETLSAFGDVLNIEQRIRDFNEALSHRTDYHSSEYMDIIQSLSEANERFDLLGGASIEADVEQILLGLGFLRTDFNRQTNEFSGGWRMRIELAKILLCKPNVFLLDEPTNHLDIESIQWLEDFLKVYPGAVLIISHDRAFLDNVTDRTIEISLGKIADYRAPYSKYVELRKERREQQMAAFTNQQKMIEQTEKFIERFRYKATKAVQVQSRIKQLDKIERLEVEDEDNSAIHFRFPPAPRTGTVVLDVKHLTKRYGDFLVLDDIDLVIERGEKVAFVGRNGEGKTTLSRIIMGELDYEGDVKLGHNVNIGYYAQNQDEIMDSSKTVFQTIDEAAVGDVRKEIRSILGAFLFGGDSIDKKVNILSGGERSRLALAKLLLQPYSLIVLDEPTNHLDMRSKEILKQALLQYDGTLILVSHDRDFLDGLVSKVYEIRNHGVKEHLGGIYDFLQKKKIESLREIERKEKQANEKRDEKASENKAIYLERKEFEKKLRKMRNQISKTEERISQIEKEIAKCDRTLANPDGFTIDQVFYKRYNAFKKELDTEMDNWEKLHAELEIEEALK